MTTLSLHLAGEQDPDVLARRVGQVARYFNGGEQLDALDAIDLLIIRLTEAERTLAKIAHALNGDGRRAA